MSNVRMVVDTKVMVMAVDANKAAALDDDDDGGDVTEREFRGLGRSWEIVSVRIKREYNSFQC